MAFCFVDALRQSDALAVSLVAEIDSLIVGHIAMSPVTVSDDSQGWFGLGPVSVLPSEQKKGIGSQLVEAALESVKRLGGNGCVLLGSPKYYSRFGFRRSVDLLYPDAPAEHFQFIRFGAVEASGTVCFHPAFGSEG